MTVTDTLRHDDIVSDTASDAATQERWRSHMLAQRWSLALDLALAWRSSQPKALLATLACLVPLLLLAREDEASALLLEGKFTFGSHPALLAFEAVLARETKTSSALTKAELVEYASAQFGARLGQLFAAANPLAALRACVLWEQQLACAWGRANARSKLGQTLGDLAYDLAAGTAPQWEPARFISLGFSHAEHTQITIANSLADAWPAAAAPKAVVAESARLRVGYLSERLAGHATTVLMAQIPAHQDHSRLELFVYARASEHVAAASDIEVRGCDHVRVLSTDPALAAAQIRADSIDVLIVLPDWRMEWLAQVVRASAAPVVISYLSFCASTGGLAHYRIVDDSYVDDSHVRAHAREATLTLRGSYYAYSAKLPLRTEAPTRTSLGLPENAVVIAAFNAAYKLSPALCEAWAGLLSAHPHAVLWLHQTHPMQAVLLPDWFLEHGITRSRLVFAQNARHDIHVQRLTQADVYLDAWDIGGHTSVLDALAAGVPVVTLEGSRIAQRVGAVLLREHGARDWVASSEREYTELASRLISSAEERAAYRALLQKQRGNFAPFNLPLQARKLDAAIAAAYARYQAGLPPADLIIEVTAA